MWLEEDTLTWWGETPSSQMFHAPLKACPELAEGLDRVSPHLLNGRVYLRGVVPSPPWGRVRVRGILCASKHTSFSKPEASRTGAGGPLILTFSPKGEKGPQPTQLYLWPCGTGEELSEPTSSCSMRGR